MVANDHSSLVACYFFSEIKHSLTAKEARPYFTLVTMPLRGCILEMFKLLTQRTDTKRYPLINWYSRL